MPKPTPELYVQPLLYEVLSGEFQPSSDPQQRAHTLGRLAFATFSKGTRSLIRELPPPIPKYTYAPSWTPNVIAAITCDTPRRSARTLLLYGIELRDAQDHHLNVYRDYRDGTQPHILIGTPGDELRLPMALGDQLTSARDAVTEAASAFFDRAAQA